MDDKGEIVVALLEGWKRQDLAKGYCRAFAGMLKTFPNGLDDLERSLPFDIVQELRKSKFNEVADISEDLFHAQMARDLEEFICPVTGMKFL